MASPDDNDDHRLLLLSKLDIQSRRSSGLGSNTDDYEHEDDCWEGVESTTIDEAEEGVTVDEEKDHFEQQLSTIQSEPNVGNIQIATNISPTAKTPTNITPIHRYVPASSLSLISSVSSTGCGGVSSDPTLSNSTCHSHNSNEERGNSATTSPASLAATSSATTFRQNHFRSAYRKQQEQQQVSPNQPKSKISGNVSIFTSSSSISTKGVSKESHPSFDNHNRQSPVPEDEYDDDSVQNENDDEEEVNEDDEITVVYNDGATPLFKAIEEEDWKQVERICRQDAKQASIWIISTGTVQTTFNWSLWKRLPLHEMCRRHPPASTVFRLIEAYPDACRAVTQFGELPLHLAIECGASAAVVTTLISAHWRGLFHQDQCGRTPVDVLRDTEPLLDLLEHQSVQTAFELSTRTYNEIQTEQRNEIAALRNQHDVGLKAVRAQHDNDLAIEQEQQDKLLQQVGDLQAVIQQLNTTVADHQRVIDEQLVVKQQMEIEHRNLQVEKNEYKRRLLQSYEHNDNLVETLNQRNDELKDANAKIAELQNAIQDIAQYQKFVMQRESVLTSQKLQQAFDQYTTMTSAIDKHTNNLNTLVQNLGIPGKPPASQKVTPELDSTIHTVEDSIFGDVLDEHPTTIYRPTKHSIPSHHQRRQQRRLERLKKQGEEKKHDGDEIDDDSLLREDSTEQDEAVVTTDDDGSLLALEETAKAAERAMMVTSTGASINYNECRQQSTGNVIASDQPINLKKSDRAASTSRVTAPSTYTSNRSPNSIAQSASVITGQAFRESKHRVSQSDVLPINDSISPQQSSHINQQSHQESPRRFSRHYRSLSAASSPASTHSMLQSAVASTYSKSNAKGRQQHH